MFEKAQSTFEKLYINKIKQLKLCFCQLRNSISIEINYFQRKNFYFLFQSLMKFFPNKRLRIEFFTIHDAERDTQTPTQIDKLQDDFKRLKLSKHLYLVVDF